MISIIRIIFPYYFYPFARWKKYPKRQPLQKINDFCKYIDMLKKKRCVGLSKETIVAICPTHLKSCRVFILCAVMHNGLIYQMAGYLTHLDQLYLMVLKRSPL